MPDPDPPTPPNPAPASKGGPETFSREYVHELREESKTYRLKANELEQANKAAADAVKKAGEEAAGKIKEAQTAADQRVIRAELKAAAIKAGMIDLDGLKLADLSKVKLDAETGEVVGADELMVAMKKSKPYLFGVANSSTSGDPPNPASQKPKKATEMSKEEYAAAKAALGIR